jgi:biotin synthase
MFQKDIISITEKILKEPDYSVSYEDACEIVALPEKYTLDLLTCADKIRNRFKKNHVFTCSIINAKSGFCSQDCAFCAQSSHHETGIETYPLLSRTELVDKALGMHRAGASKFSFVTSGYMLTDQEIDTVCQAASIIKKQSDLLLCASLGMLTEPTAKKLKESGVTRYHHNLETSRSYFNQVCSTHEYDEDIQSVQRAAAAGLQVCCGGILGLGESWDQRVELALTLRELKVDSIPINFLNPISGTKMADRPLLSPLEALKCIALFRLANPEKDITICGGREVTLGDFQSWVFMAGANGLMVGDYLTTEGRNIQMDLDMIRKMELINGND